MLTCLSWAECIHGFDCNRQRAHTHRYDLIQAEVMLGRFRLHDSICRQPTLPVQRAAFSRSIRSGGRRGLQGRRVPGTLRLSDCRIVGAVALPCAENGVVRCADGRVGWKGISRRPSAKTSRLLRHVQIAGVPGHHEPTVGEINYPYLFDLLDELGYQGWVGCEYRPRADTWTGLSWAVKYGIRDVKPVPAK